MTYPESITIITDEISQELAVIRQFLREHHLPGLELRSFAGTPFKDLTPAQIGELARVVRDEDWRVFACATPVFKCDLDDPRAIREHGELFRRSLETAHSLHCNLLRVFTFHRTASRTETSQLHRAAEHIQPLAELAEEAGIRIGIENEYSCLAATAEELQTVLADLPVESVGAIWDPCNVLYLPEAPAPSAEAVCLLAPRLLHVHVKDAVRGPYTAENVAASAAPVGAGTVDWKTQLGALRDVGYKGMLSLETHWRANPLDERQLHLPGGHAFSHGGEEASRISLRALRSILEQF
jgi:sugar phosphate isomerase/epimerase